jgi:hypothetical protein
VKQQQTTDGWIIGHSAAFKQKLKAQLMKLTPGDAGMLSAHPHPVLDGALGRVGKVNKLQWLI